MKQLTLLLTLVLLALGACRLEELLPDPPDTPNEVEDPMPPEYCMPNTFQRTYNEDIDYRAFEITSIDSNTFVVCGTTGADQVFFMEIDTLGNKKSQHINTETDIYINTVLHTNEGRFIICGEQNDKAYLALYNAQGIFITDTDDIHPDASVCYDIVLTKNDVYTLAGSRGALNQGQYEDDIYVGQAQIIGNNIEIIKEYLPNKQYGSQRAKVINRKSNGELLIGGHNELSPGEWYAHFLEMNDTLGYLDEENIGFGSNLEVYPEDMIPVSGNGHLVVGYLRDNDNQVAALEMMAFRVNGNGDIQGGTMPNLYSHEGLNSIGFAAAPATEAGKYILTGYRKISANREEGYLVKIDENGNIDWEESYGNINTRLLATVAYTGNCGSGYISVGYSGETGNRRIFAIKTNAEGIVE